MYNYKENQAKNKKISAIINRTRKTLRIELKGKNKDRKYRNTNNNRGLWLTDC